jgi:hypothetical protein
MSKITKIKEAIEHNKAIVIRTKIKGKQEIITEILASLSGLDLDKFSGGEEWAALTRTASDLMNKNIYFEGDKNSPDDALIIEC